MKKQVCLEENLVYLNGKNVLYPKVSEIILNFIKKDEKNYNWLWDNLCQFKNIFQYIHCVYPDVHCSTERRNSVLKSTFQLVFKICKNLLLPTSQAWGKEFSKLWGWETNIFWTRGKTGKNWWF